jgi:hypothetical protein
VVIRLDASEQPGMPRIRPLPVSVAKRMASVPWLCRQAAHEARARLLSRGSGLGAAPEQSIVFSVPIAGGVLGAINTRLAAEAV